MIDIFGFKRIRAEFAYTVAMVSGLCAILQSPENETVAQINAEIKRKREDLE